MFVIARWQASTPPNHGRPMARARTSRAAVTTMDRLPSGTSKDASSASAFAKMFLAVLQPRCSITSCTPGEGDYALTPHPSPLLRIAAGCPECDHKSGRRQVDLVRPPLQYSHSVLLKTSNPPVLSATSFCRLPLMPAESDVCRCTVYSVVWGRRLRSMILNTAQVCPASGSSTLSRCGPATPHARTFSQCFSVAFL